MGSDDNCDLGLQQTGGGSHLNSPSSGIYTNPQPGKVAINTISLGETSSGGGNAYFGWDPMLSLAHSGGPLMVSQHLQIPISSYGTYGNQGGHPVQFPTDPRFIGLAPKLPCFGSGNFRKLLVHLVVQSAARLLILVALLITLRIRMVLPKIIREILHLMGIKGKGCLITTQARVLRVNANLSSNEKNESDRLD
ncbi:hypothetical protein MKX01_032298 [Papaver californicum]|nr:hypothetical protein MKX01_032298 [Papaver californicum]